FAMERKLASASEAVSMGRSPHPVRLPYAIAQTVKGFGFSGAGTNRAHNLPLENNPASDEHARDEFNRAPEKLWVSADLLASSSQYFNQHETQKRVRERDHPLAHREVAFPLIPSLPWRNSES